MSKPLLKPILAKIPLKMDVEIVDRIDDWARKLNYSRAGLARFMICLSGPIVQAMIETLTEDLRACCAEIKSRRMLRQIFHGCPPSPAPLPTATTLHDERTRAEDSATAAAVAAAKVSGKPQKPRRRQKDTAKARAKSKARASACSEDGSNHTGPRSRRRATRRRK